MNCNKCGTANDVGSKFCKECGQKLPDSPNETRLNSDEHLKVGEFVYLAYRESEAGHLDHAIEACQGALAIKDGNPAIHALLASLYERKGDQARAIYEYERVVSLNPGSLEDRRKLEQLRMQLVSPTPVAAPPRPRLRLSDIRWLQNRKALMPWVTAVGAFIIVIILGSLILRNPSKHADSTGVGTQGRTSTATGPGSGIPSRAVPYGGQSALAPNQPGLGQQMGHPNAPDEIRSDQNASTPEDKQSKPGIPSVRLPGTATAPQPAAKEQDRQPAPPSKEDDRPVIVPIIPRPQAPSGSKPVTPAPAKPPQSSKSAEERGMELQRMGKYDDAISAYREALNQTSDSGRIYQHMALSYQRKGDHSSAIDNYNRAVKSYRDQLTSGRDRSEVDRNIRACEAGIEVSRNQR